MVNMIGIPESDEKVGVKKEHVFLGVFAFQHFVDHLGGDFYTSFFQVRSMVC